MVITFPNKVITLYRTLINLNEKNNRIVYTTCRIVIVKPATSGWSNNSINVRIMASLNIADKRMLFLAYHLLVESFSTST